MKILNNLISFIVCGIVILVLGCAINADAKYQKELLKDINKITTIIAESEKISEKDKGSYYKKVSSTLYVSSVKNANEYIIKNKEPLTRSIEGLKKFVDNENNEIENAAIFTIGIALYNLSQADPAYSDQAITFYEKILLKNLNFEFEKPIMKILNKSKSIKWLIANFNNQQYRDIVGSPKEYFLRLIVSSYLQKGDIELAKERIKKAKNQNFDISFLESIERYIDKYERIHSKKGGALS